MDTNSWFMDQMAAGASEPPKDAAPKRIIVVVSSDPALGWRLRDEIGEPDVEVVSANSDAEINRYLSRSGLALVVLDDGSGPVPAPTLLRFLAEHPATSWVPVVVLLPRSGGDDAHELLAMGADVCLRAPLQPGVLGELIRVRLRRAALLRSVGCSDPTTGLPTGGTLGQIFALQLRTARRNRDVFSAGMIALEGYSEMVDASGIAVADDEVQEVAAAMTASFRGSDLLGRWSPTEFLVFMPGTPQAGANWALARALHGIEQSSAAPTATSSAALRFRVAAVEVEPGEALVSLVQRLRDAPGRGDHADPMSRGV